ncbi:cytochrome P450 [Nocardia brasiliensis]|uniref:cytochrome P450 n=1 Tax=Nocardia brasiliensis TaxID=37326 RepID=UPI001EECB9A5|nr:cytochrome P450 [Nocardia brasiliensis]
MVEIRLNAETTVKDTIPAVPVGLPLIGHLTELRRLGPFLASLPAHGSLVRLRFGVSSVVVVCDPALTEQLLRDDRTFDKGGPLYEQGRALLGGGLALCPYEQHRRLRRLVQPAFHRQRIPGYMAAKTDIVASVIGGWHDGQTIDVAAEMRTIIAKGFLAAVFPAGMHSATKDRILADLDTVLGGLLRRMILPPWLDRLALPWHRRDARATARLHEVIYAAIDARRGSTTDHADLLTALLNARDPASNKPQLSDRQIVETILGLLLGGMDTTAAALSWTWFTLAEHPDIRRRVHAEIDGVLQGRHATYADLPRLELTARVVTEVLRIWPPSWLVTRVATMDTQLGEYSIPAGTNLVYSPYIIHHRADQYADPDLFDPDRWLPGHAIPRYAFLPFGAGGRKCIGETLATPDTILTLATIATRWRLERISDCRVRPKVGAFSGPRRLKMRVVARTSSA